MKSGNNFISYADVVACTPIEHRQCEMLRGEARLARGWSVIEYLLEKAGATKPKIIPQFTRKTWENACFQTAIMSFTRNLGRFFRDWDCLKFSNFFYLGVEI